MPASCPYCHGPLTHDTATQAPPTHCPHCGNALPASPEEPAAPEDSGGKPSLATFLKTAPPPAEPEPPEPAPDSAADVPTQDTAAAEDKGDAAPATDIPQAGTTTAEAGEVPASVDPLEATPTLAATSGPASEDPAQSEDGDEPVPATPVTETTADAMTGEPVPTPAMAASPSFNRTAHEEAGASSRASRWPWLALVLLILVLALQIALADRNRLAADPDWRPVVLALCKAFGCSVPDWHEPKAFTMLDRNVRPAPGMPGTLDVTAIFRNDARWPQAWPTVLLKLSDADGRIIGARAIAPRDYLADPTESTTLAPGQSTRIAIRVHEPDAGAVSFAFEFH